MSGQVVQITINVTDANASEAVQQVVTQLNALGPAGQAAGAEAGAGLDQVGEHSVTAREQVRLLSEEMGMHVPRAMQTVIANSQVLATAIGAIAPAMIAIGGVDILVQMGEEVYNAYQKYGLLRDAIDDSNAAITRMGEATEASMKRASDEMERYIRLTYCAKAGDQYKLADIQTTQIGIPLYKDEQFKNLPDTIKGDFEQITGESVMPKDLDSTIEKLQTYVATEQRALDLEQQMQSINAAGMKPDPTSGSMGQFSATQDLLVQEQEQRVNTGRSLLDQLLQRQQEYSNSVQAQQAQIEQDAIAKEKEKQDTILSLENNARNSTLSGDALLEAQREEAIDNFVRKYGQSRAAIDAINADYAQKEIELWQKQWDEADKAMRAAEQAAQQQAHTGLGSIEYERQNAMTAIGAKNLSPDLAEKERGAANLKANTEILAAQQEFEDQMQQIGMRSDDQQAQGYARIAAEAEQSIKKVQDDWQRLADKVGALSTAGIDAQLKAVDQILQINDSAAQAMLQLHQRTSEQTAKEEEQAARQSLSAWQQTALAIQDEWQDKVRAIGDEENRQLAHLKANSDAAVMVEKDADAKRVAAHDLMIAQMIQAEEEMRDRLAQGLESLFSDPARFFEKRAMDTAFQLMANEMLSTFKSSSPAGGILQYLFGMGPEMSTSADPLTAMGSALGQRHGMAGMSSTAAVNPSIVQFQQSSMTLLTAGQMLVSAASSLQSAVGAMAASGGLGISSMSGGGGLSLPGFGGAAISTASGSGGGFDFSSIGASTNSMMLPGFAGSSSFVPAAVSGTWDNSMMLPGLNGVASEGTLGSVGGAAVSAGKGLAGAAGIAGGLLMAGTSIYSAYQNSDPLSGALGGAMGGMEAGAALGSIVPGIGTLVGAIGGALIGGIGGLFAGIFGDKGRGQAQTLDVNTIQPALTKDMQDYEAGRAGYNTLATELNSMLISAQNQTNQMGSGARSYFNDNISPEIHAVLSSLQRQEIGGRSQITLSAAQYHAGGWIGGFGDLGTSETEGFVHAMQDEFVVNPVAAAAHAPILQAMNSGTNFAYSNSVQPRMPVNAGGNGSVHLTIQALDSKSVAQWAKAGGGLALMAALNQAQKQYSGVGRG